MQESDVSGLGHPPDTWADMRGWGKGVLWVNGFNLGWYWPLLGPQMRIFVPGPLLRAGSNEILLLEFAQVPDGATGELCACWPCSHTNMQACTHICKHERKL